DRPAEGTAEPQHPAVSRVPGHQLMPASHWRPGSSWPQLCTFNSSPKHGHAYLSMDHNLLGRRAAPRSGAMRGNRPGSLSYLLHVAEHDRRHPEVRDARVTADRLLGHLERILERGGGLEPQVMDDLTLTADDDDV